MKGANWSHLELLLRALPLAAGDVVEMSIDRIRGITGGTERLMPVDLDDSMNRKGELPALRAIHNADFGVVSITLQRVGGAEAEVRSIALEKS